MTDWSPTSPLDARPPLHRSPDRKVAGIAAGIADYFSISANIVRALFGVFALAGGAGFLLYLGLWILIPLPPEARAADGSERSTRSSILGGGLLAMAALLGLLTIDGFDSLRFLMLSLVFVGVALLNRRPKNLGTPPAPMPVPPPVDTPAPSPFADFMPQPMPEPQTSPVPDTSEITDAFNFPDVLDIPPEVPDAADITDVPDITDVLEGEAEPIEAQAETTVFEVAADDWREPTAQMPLPGDSPDQTTPLPIDQDLEEDSDQGPDQEPNEDPDEDEHKVGDLDKDKDLDDQPWDTPEVELPLAIADPPPPIPPAPPQSLPLQQPQDSESPAIPRAHWAVTKTAEETSLTAESPDAPSTPLASITLAAILAVVGVALVLNTLADIFVGAVTVSGIGLAFVGMAIAVTSYRGTTLPLIPIALAALVALLASPTIDHAIQDGTGSKNLAVDRIEDLESRYVLGVGELELDLRELELTEDTTVDVEVGTGSLEVWVPRDMVVELNAKTTVGYAWAFNDGRGGINPKLRIRPPSSTDPDAPRLFLNAETTIGGIDVYRG